MFCKILGYTPPLIFQPCFEESIMIRNIYLNTELNDLLQYLVKVQSGENIDRKCPKDKGEMPQPEALEDVWSLDNILEALGVDL